MIDIGWKQDRIKEIREIIKMDKELLGEDAGGEQRNSEIEGLQTELKGLIGETLNDLKEIEAQLIQEGVDALRGDSRDAVSLSSYMGGDPEETKDLTDDEILAQGPSKVQMVVGVKRKARRSKEQIVAFWTERIERIKPDWKTISSVAVLLRVAGDERGWKITREKSANKILGHFEFNMLRDMLRVNRGY